MSKRGLLNATTMEESWTWGIGEPPTTPLDKTPITLIYQNAFLQQNHCKPTKSKIV
jgi:hypothetical protein